MTMLQFIRRALLKDLFAPLSTTLRMWTNRAVILYSIHIQSSHSVVFTNGTANSIVFTGQSFRRIHKQSSHSVVLPLITRSNKTPKQNVHPQKQRVMRTACDKNGIIPGKFMLPQIPLAVFGITQWTNKQSIAFFTALPPTRLGKLINRYIHVCIFIEIRG